MLGFNPTFKPPTAAQQPGRSPSPPRRYVEPLSPARPRPIEPVFNYPALNNHVNYEVRPEQPFIAPPAARDKSVSYGAQERPYNATPRTRHRSSTIEQLAEAALATSPPYQVHSSGGPSAHGYAPPVHSEPPHKRSRSELLPSPLIAQYASRPATSYENFAWPVQQAQHGEPVYDRRVEEAALLLNFRTGGWTIPKLPPPTFPGPLIASSAPRPHANSFPQDSHQPRPVDLVPQAALLPPFNPQHSTQSRLTLPSPQQTVVDSHSSPSDDTRKLDFKHKNGMHSEDVALQCDVEMKDAPQQTQTQTPPDEDISRAQSTDVAMSETSETATSKARRGGSKGKARASGGRKSIAEKAASRRAAARKKTPDASKAKRNASVLAVDDFADVHERNRNRRKSVSDLAFTERDPDNVHRAQSVPRDTPMIIRPVSLVKAASRRKAKDDLEIICAGCATAREAKHLNGELDEWISCNGCKNWFHVDCAGFKKAIEVRDVDKYFCTSCEPTHGKTTYVRKSSRAHASVDYAELQRGVLKTSEEDNEHHYIQPIKDGTFQFDPESFPRMRPELVTRDIFERSATFTEPICIPAAWNPRPWLEDHPSRKTSDEENGSMSSGEDATLFSMRPDDYEYDTVQDVGQDRLGMVMPEELTVRQVCNLVGPDTPLDVIDVKTQNSGSKWTLSRWADYYEEDGDDKPIRNVISLEVSQTKLGRLLRRPKIVRDIDLQDDVWPQKEIDLGKWPKVQFYCLMSVADSYTDFHIDFGGSSVYYHILKGKKTFFFIPPKAKHLKAYEEWNDSPQQNYTFLPNITKECYRVDLSEGDTMLIPSGWIHAVWTPETSLVIGGNFLTRMSFQNQFKVVDIEKANETPMKFRYPYFQKIMWYTAIKYLKTDPLPDAVRQLLHDGQRFEREQPVWADFDGDLAANDPRPGAKNTRYYGQAELDGLPDLVTFIFHTVMLVMGRVEGISADRMKRVNASIPKGHGEPLEVAKTFALWVAWKRNEDPPAWAHPDAVLPNSKEGAPKKLSARALKDLERKEAIAAWRLAPDRQSARVRSNATATASGSNAHGPAAIISTSTPPDRENTHHQNLSSHHQTPSQLQPTQTYARPTMPAQATPMAAPMNLMVGGLPHLSSPKTSVLGPKRVACDACRKRRIRCKHKDMVLQTSPNGTNGMHYVLPDAQYNGRGMHDNIVVKSATDGQDHGLAPNGIQGQPMPGTNAYVNAHIPMAVNGVAIFDPSKRGRTKACYECRKSKRRCVHDEKGNVDPVKASETPVARGSGASKKRPIPLEEATPIQSKKPKSVIAGEDMSPVPIFHQHQASPVLHAHQLHTSLGGDSYQSQVAEAQMTANGHNYPQHHQLEQHVSHAPLDPTLFAYQAEPDNGSYGANSYSYPTPERPHLYQMQSLEQIASEVLDMNADYHDDQQEAQSNGKEFGNAPMPHGLPADSPGAGESVDSGVSLPGSEHMERNGAYFHKEDAADMTNEQSAALAAYTVSDQDDAKVASRPDFEAPVEMPSTITTEAPPSTNDHCTSSLPLYRPPAPLSQSSEQSKRLPSCATPESHAQTNGHKRKRSSVSQMHGPKQPLSKPPGLEAQDLQQDGVTMQNV